MGFNYQERVDELRAEDPRGTMSDAQLEQIVNREYAAHLVDALPDHTDEHIDIKNALRAILDCL